MMKKLFATVDFFTTTLVGYGLKHTSSSNNNNAPSLTYLARLM